MPSNYPERLFVTGPGLIARTQEGPGPCSLIEQQQTLKDLMGITEATFGNGIPDNADGRNGDYYVDVETGNVYHKENFTWF